ncbi:MAG TPA: sigma-70 family RNA polymerase sigma factor [Candidatus Limnocylindrales bacterium]|nr:sigma-70 family RNA polymerase sigma factor [Candidatus Limnocylindrales bacterium]
MARPVFWRSGAADAAPRLGHLDLDRPQVDAARRDPARFDALYRRYLAQVYSYAYYELGDHHAAEDATERTFLAALANLHRFTERAKPSDGEGASTFRVWLFRIARNIVANERRTAWRHPADTLDERATSLADAAAAADVEATVVRRDEAGAAMAAVGRLTGDRRRALVLRFVDEMSTAEIAGVLGKSEGAVRVLIHRALRNVARDLGIDRPKERGRPGR